MPDTTPTQASHNLHIVGIGRTGAAHVEALIRTGEIEDMLAAPGACFAALLIDIGDDDIQVPDDYAHSLKARLASRGIPAERFHYASVALPLPEAKALPKGAALPQDGAHVPRAVAKAVYSSHINGGTGMLDGLLQGFVAHVASASAPATVLLAYGLAGGTGSGMAMAVAHQLRAQLPASAKIVGVAQLSHSGDGDYYNSGAQYQALDALDAALQDSHSPLAGCFVVSSEQSWQRLSAYTSTGLKEVRQRFKQMVTNRFVADSFMRFAASSGGAHLLRALQHAPGKCTLFDVAKLTHPGVQVLPGEAASKWDAVLQQWIGFVPQYSGLSSSFKTDYAEVHVHASRDMPVAAIDAALKQVVSANYLKDAAAQVLSFHSEFFDVLTAYSNVILPGMTKSDLTGYQAAKASFDKLDARAKVLETA
jgi:hypothetical protein